MTNTTLGKYMLLLRNIKADQLEARKTGFKDTAKTLTTLIGEASMVGKNDGNRESTDDEVITVIKKFVKNNYELMHSIKEGSKLYVGAVIENELLIKYLPVQMTERDLREVVQKYLVKMDDISPRMMGKVMKWLKDNYGGKYEGGMASRIVKELLK